MRASLAPLGLAALIALPATLEASPIDSYTGAVVFGDSLSDAEVPYLPPSIYPELQFSNGENWASIVGLGAASGTNFAQADATAAETLDGVDDLVAQIETFATSGIDLGPNPLAYLWFGGNDVARALIAGDPSLIGEGLAAYANGLALLAGLGFEDLVLFTVPDVGRTPRVASLGPAAQAAGTGLTEAFNLGLRGAAAAAAGTFGLDIAFVDSADVAASILSDPGALGITNVDDACFVPGVSFCGLENADQYVYYDPFHPTEVVHRQFAAAALDATASLAPVPLPAGLPLLAFAIAGLALARRKVA